MNTVMFTTTNGYPVLIDVEDFHAVSGKKWYYQKGVYSTDERSQGRVSLNVFLAGKKKGRWFHRNRNPLDFRRENIW